VKSLLWFGELSGQQYALDAEFRLWRLEQNPVAEFSGDTKLGLRVALQGDGPQRVEEILGEALNQGPLYETTFKVLSSEPLYPHEVKGLEEAVGQCIKNQLIPAVVELSSTNQRRAGAGLPAPVAHIVEPPGENIEICGFTFKEAGKDE